MMNKKLILAATLASATCSFTFAKVTELKHLNPIETIISKDGEKLINEVPFTRGETTLVQVIPSAITVFLLFNQKNFEWMKKDPAIAVTANLISGACGWLGTRWLVKKIGLSPLAWQLIEKAKEARKSLTKHNLKQLDSCADALENPTQLEEAADVNYTGKTEFTGYPLLEATELINVSDDQLDFLIENLDRLLSERNDYEGKEKLISLVNDFGISVDKLKKIRSRLKATQQYKEQHESYYHSKHQHSLVKQAEEKVKQAKSETAQAKAEVNRRHLEIAQKTKELLTGKTNTHVSEVSWKH